MNCVIYTRVSSKEQEKEGFSIPAQKKLLREYAQQQSFTITQEFTDIETAKASGRTQFQKLLNFLRENKDIKIILVEKTDRLYRNFKDYVLLEELDIELHLVKENEIISKESKSHAKFIHGIKVLLAKNYIDNLSEEVKKGMKEKAEQGQWPHLAPLGYLNNKETRKIIIDPERGSIIVELFKLYATGSYSITTLRDKAKELGLKYRHSNTYSSRSAIEKILKNPIYTGKFIWKGKLFQGTHKPLISEELFQEVQTQLKIVSKPKKFDRKFAFRGLLTCGYCGCGITAEIKKGKYIYYRCTNGKGKCEQPYIREEDLSILLTDLVEQIRIEPHNVIEIKEALKNSFQHEKEFRKTELRKLKKKYDTIQNRLDQSYIDKIESRIDTTFWQKTHEQWIEEQNNITKQISRFEKANRNYYQEGLSFLELSQNAYSHYVNQKTDEQAGLLKKLLSNCTIKGVTLCPTYRTPFNLLIDTPKSELWRRR